MKKLYYVLNIQYREIHICTKIVLEFEIALGFNFQKAIDSFNTLAIKYLKESKGTHGTYIGDDDTYIQKQLKIEPFLVYTEDIAT